MQMSEETSSTSRLVCMGHHQTSPIFNPVHENVTIHSSCAQGFLLRVQQKYVFSLMRKISASIYSLTSRYLATGRSALHLDTIPAEGDPPYNLRLLLLPLVRPRKFPPGLHLKRLVPFSPPHRLTLGTSHPRGSRSPLMQPGVTPRSWRREAGGLVCWPSSCSPRVLAKAMGSPSAWRRRHHGGRFPNSSPIKTHQRWTASRVNSGRPYLLPASVRSRIPSFYCRKHRR